MRRFHTPTDHEPSSDLARRVRIALVAAVALTSLATASWAEPLATVAGKRIDRSEVEEHARVALDALERQRSEVVERALDDLVERRLFAAEAERRGIDLETLLAEIEGAVSPVSEAEVDAWYEQNRARVGRPKAEVATQIVQFLTQQRVAQERGSRLEALRERFDVSLSLDPFRVAIPEAATPTTLGPDEAPVTLVAFSDFQCPACRRIAPVLEEAHERYGDRLRVEFRQFPLESIHPQARKAAEAALCAADQGKFWPMHDALFADQRALALDDLERRAETLELDAEAFGACLREGRHDATVSADLDAGLAIGVGSTPSLFVNGRPLTLYRGTPAVDQIGAVIDDELTRRPASR